MGRHHGIAQPLAQVSRRAFRHAPRVDEDQRGSMLTGQYGQPVIDQLPDSVTHHCFQRDRRHFQRQVTRPAMAHIDDFAMTIDTDQEISHCLDGFLCRREPDAH